jgi:hypothetical protein
MLAAPVAVELHVTAYSKGRPSGIWAKLPAFMVRWFTWRRTKIGELRRRLEFPLDAPGVKLFDGRLAVHLDPDLRGATILVDGFAFDHVDFDTDNEIPIKMSAAGFDVVGHVSIEPVAE